MLDNLYAAVTDLPVIVQGALGSGLFAAVLFFGQRFFAYANRRISDLTKDNKRRYLIEQQIKYRVLAAKGIPERGAFVSLLIYRASRSLFKALIWLTTGLIFGSLGALLGLIGYFGCLYYLFSGLNTVAGPEKVPDVDARLEEIRSALKELDDAQPPA